MKRAHDLTGLPLNVSERVAPPPDAAAHEYDDVEVERYELSAPARYRF